jgi:hypothetical protein
MSLRKTALTSLFAILFIAGIANQQPTLAQTTDQQKQETTKQDETNLDTQLFLIVASNQEVPDRKVPASLDSVVKQLRSTLQFKNYHLAATLINRVKNDGRLSLKWLGGPLIASVAATSQVTSFNEFKVVNVRLVQDASGQQLVKMEGFSFGARIPIPIQAGGAVATTGTPPPTVWNYESTGLNTDISMREGEPVIVGTLNVGPSGDAIILVMTAKRSNR